MIAPIKVAVTRTPQFQRVIAFTCRLGRHDYETVNQMEDDVLPLRRFNSIQRERGEGWWFMIASPKRDGDLYLATADLVSRELRTDWIGRKRENHPTARRSVNLRRRNLTVPSRSNHSQFFFSDRFPFPVSLDYPYIIFHLIFNLLLLPLLPHLSFPSFSFFFFFLRMTFAEIKNSLFSISAKLWR